METLRTLLCFYEMGNSNLAVEKLEDTYKYIVDSAFDEMYIIRKLKQKNTCLRIIVGMKKCGQVTYEKQFTGCIGRRESRTLILENIHNIQMCLPLKPVLSRDRRGLPNFIDEPTAGLDPKERIRIRNLISDLSQDRIVLIATHVVSDIEFISKEILLMKKADG